MSHGKYTSSQKPTSAFYPFGPSRGWPLQAATLRHTYRQKRTSLCHLDVGNIFWIPLGFEGDFAMIEKLAWWSTACVSQKPEIESHLNFETENHGPHNKTTFHSANILRLSIDTARVTKLIIYLDLARLVQLFNEQTGLYRLKVAAAGDDIRCG